MREIIVIDKLNDNVEKALIVDYVSKQVKWKNKNSGAWCFRKFDEVEEIRPYTWHELEFLRKLLLLKEVKEYVFKNKSISDSVYMKLSAELSARLSEKG
jgi:hypothetical protein